MAPSRLNSNGRAPTPSRQQRQITSFFSPGKSPIQHSTPSSKENPSSSLPSQGKRKPLLTIGPTSPVSKLNLDSDDAGGTPCYGDEVVGRMVRVYWPLDDEWYSGRIGSFDKISSKHLIRYDDGEEELIDLAAERFEWVRRLRRKSECRVDGAKKSEMLEDALEIVFEKESYDVESGDDDSEDEDWGKSVGKGKTSDDDEDDDSEELEEELENVDQGFLKKSTPKRRKNCDGKKLDSANAGRKKSRVVEEGVKIAPSFSGGGGVHDSGIVERGLASRAVDNILKGAAEKFGSRETEKFNFLGKGRKDANGRSPSNENYDPRTLYLPPNFLKSLAGGQRQWWEFKSKHMDKVLFFKMGKFYELFEMDAHIGAKELDLQYMKGDQPHVGFPEKNFSMNAEKLAMKGYRVLVIEQTETPEQLEIRRKKMGSKDKVVKREICAVITKGTLTEGEMVALNPDAAYLMSVTERPQASGSQNDNDVILGICVADVSTSKFMLGQFTDDSERQRLCSILAELRPVELIKPAKVISPETEKVLLRHTRNPLVNDLIPSLEFWDAEKTVCEVTGLYRLFKDQSAPGSLNDSENISVSTRTSSDTIGNCSGFLPNVLSELVSAGENGQYALSALGGCLFYLRQTFLDETLLRFASFDLFPWSGNLDTFQKLYMTLDAAALENLEIFENSKNGGTTGTLFAQLDHCVTAFGKRLLKNWLARPLYHVSLIRERQDAVADLKGIASARALEFRKALSKLTDMERLLARLFASSEANGRNSSKVVLYEDASKKQLQEFIAALRGCELMEQACSSFDATLTSIKSSLLRHILTPGKGLPEIHLILKHFVDAFDWLEADSTGRIIPHEGVDLEYDSACKALIEIETSLLKHLKEQRKVLGDASINYVTVGKEQYLLEVPEKLQSDIPGNYDLRSSKKGYFRYWTPEIKKLLLKLSQAEAEKGSKLKSIQQKLIGSFCEHHVKWKQLVSTIAGYFLNPRFHYQEGFEFSDNIRSGVTKVIERLAPNVTFAIEATREIAQFRGKIGRFGDLTAQTAVGIMNPELDVLISLAIASDYYEGPACRPTISATSSLNEGMRTPCLSAKCLGHPTLRSDALGKGSFVPNDVSIGGAGLPFFILLTGPNMGGKSTLLRQICMAVILAQVGADVPAESFKLSPVDRIFVRMGARDHIMAGQSTFLTELSETATMLTSATHNSLVVLDELGRGTSTSDGQAIAESVLELFVCKIRCRGMFSTHYHRIALDYENDPKVFLCHMACQVGRVLADVEEVTFLYKLTPGICPKSYGVNVARLAGIPDYVLRRAAVKSSEFEAIYGKHKQESGGGSSDQVKDEELAIIQEILYIGTSSNCNEISNSIEKRQLCDLQQRIRLLL